MDVMNEFIRSDIGVAIAWICGVVGFIIALIKIKENKTLKQEILKLENVRIDQGADEVSQNGKRNVYTKNNSGGMKINM
ncbi:hypothetical protein C7H79_04710 [Nitrosomonas supralitoralis]|uniref:Uncharacterized protein n=2 Tax=Nitrosomonas supralitoralis TaxID=2116706 RepID=A0A2P7NXG6_9PROT|nr:hypothetical protein C7H79_04710 [Nitrosomonas supralitoralis]